MTKKCPFCAEEIQDEAIVCRFCGRDLSPKVREVQENIQTKIDEDRHKINTANESHSEKLDINSTQTSSKVSGRLAAKTGLIVVLIYSSYLIYQAFNGLISAPEFWGNITIGNFTNFVLWSTISLFFQWLRAKTTERYDRILLTLLLGGCLLFIVIIVISTDVIQLPNLKSIIGGDSNIRLTPVYSFEGTMEAIDINQAATAVARQTQNPGALETRLAEMRTNYTPAPTLKGMATRTP